MIELTHSTGLGVFVCKFSLAPVSLVFFLCFTFYIFACLRLQTLFEHFFISFCTVTSILCMELCIFYHMQSMIQFHIPCINSMFKYNNCCISNKKNVKNARCSHILFFFFGKQKKHVKYAVWAQNLRSFPHAIN